MLQGDKISQASHSILQKVFSFSGFPSVIAIVWSICDEDAPQVAKYTYRYLFRDGVQDADPSEAAKALNRAVLRLRENRKVT